MWLWKTIHCYQSCSKAQLKSPGLENRWLYHDRVNHVELRGKQKHTSNRAGHLHGEPPSLRPISACKEWRCFSALLQVPRLKCLAYVFELSSMLWRTMGVHEVTSRWGSKFPSAWPILPTWFLIDSLKWVSSNITRQNVVLKPLDLKMCKVCPSS